MKNSKEFIQNIILKGTPEEKRELYGFDSKTPHRIILKKFKYFTRGNYPRYFTSPSAPFHDDMVMDMISSYYGENVLEAAFRGSAKTSLKKLFDTFVLLNDKDNFRKYMKVLTKDLKNSKQIVTDVYNMMVEVRYIYGDVFEKEGDTKREETMGSFTMKNGRKYASGTVGQTQRGHLQDAYRPDWNWFEDTEDRDSIRSMVITQGIMDKCAEAIDGLSKDGSMFVTCNYISDQGTVQWLMDKPSMRVRMTPLLTDDKDNTSVTWNRYSEADVIKIRKDADDFFGEFQVDPANSENKFFPLDRLNEDIKNATEPIKESAGVKYWKHYQPHHRYGQGSDHSEGVGLDSNTLSGFDFTTGELVYTYANNKIAPDLATHEFARVGGEYGHCIYAPEVNNKCGGTAITTLKSLKYPNIYQFVIPSQHGERKSKKLGWETNRKTKYTAFYDFRKDYNDGLIKIYDVNVLKEMKAYSNSDLQETTVGLITRHYDLLQSSIIAWQMNKYAEKSADTESYNNSLNEYCDA